MKTLKYIAVIALASAFLIGLAPQLSATTLTIGDSRELGLISKNQPANPTDSTTYVDVLLAQPLGSGPTSITTPNGFTNDYTRTTNDPLAGNYPAAVFALEYGAVTDIDLGSGGFLYLLAKYDGPNWGSEVWYVGGLTGNITIPQFGNGEQYGVSHVYLFNPSEGGGNGVPDGGSTLLLLSTAVGALFLARRFVVC